MKRKLIFRVLDLMESEPDRWWNAVDLAEALELPPWWPAKLYPALARLERDGSVKGAFFPNGRRLYKIYPL